MEKRKFIIKIWEDVDWEIKLFGSSQVNKKDIEIDAFAIAKSDDNRISYLFDISVKDKDLELASKSKIFLEECMFTHISYDGMKNIKQFEGTFIKALEYVKEEFKNE